MDDQDRRPQCFVAMWFGTDDDDSHNEMNQFYEIVIKPAVEECRLKPYRVDHDPGAVRLDETILNQIDKSDLVIADLTHDPKSGLRGSVIFEAGYAYREKPVIWMCREDVSANTPFDILPLKQIRWKSNKLREAKNSLAASITHRFQERAKQSEAHEIRRLVSETWDKIEKAQCISLPDGNKIAADQVRSAMFEEFCGDLRTRVKYKEMKLTSSEKYELIEIVRGFQKNVINLHKGQGLVPNLDVYKNVVEAKLRATGWL